MRHALVIGGTGMLSMVSIWLVSEGYNVSVIGRSPERMNQLISVTKDTSRITPLLVDYRFDNELKEQLKVAIKKNGPVDLVVAWIHSVGKNALKVISHELACYNHTWRLFHVLGSSSNLIEINLCQQLSLYANSIRVHYSKWLFKMVNSRRNLCWSDLCHIK